MEVVEPATAARGESASAFVHWGSAAVGAFVAAALFFVLLAFGAAIGLAVASTSPTWRDASFALWFLSGLYLILSAIVCFAAGGYLGGRLRPRFSPATAEEIEFRDGCQGLLVWAIAVLIGALLIAASAAGSRPRTLSEAPSGTASTADSLLGYQLDRLFRSDRRPRDATLSYERAEAGRILLTSSGHSGVASEDRAYLVRLVEATTGLSAADAQRRVDDVIARSREALARFRHSAVIVGFMTAVALLLGAVIAWFAASQGSRHQDGQMLSTPEWWNFSFPRYPW